MRQPNRYTMSIAIFFLFIFYTKQVLSIQGYVKISTDSIDRLNDKGKVLWSSDPDSLIVIAKQAISLSREVGYIKGGILGLKNLGSAYYEKGEYTRSIAEYEEAIVLGKDGLEDPSIMSSLHSNISLPLIMINAHKEALEHLHQALEITEIHDLAATKAHVVHNIGMLHNYQKDDNKALAHYRKSQTLYEALGDSSKSTFILGNIAHILLRQQKYAEAKAHYDRSLKLAQKFDNKKAMVNALSSIGNLYIQQKQYDTALSFLLAAKDTSEAINEKTEYLRVLQNLSQCYVELGQADKAISYGKAFLDLATEQSHLYYMQEASFILGEVYNTIRDFEMASTYFKKSKIWTDSLATVNSQNETVQLEEKFKYERQNEKVVLQYDQRLKRRQIMTIAFIVLALLLLLTVVLMNRVILQKKRNLQLVRESRLLAESQNRELYKMNHFKSHIISILGHDIKPPIENLKLMLHLIEDDFLGKEDRNRMAAIYTEQLDSTIRFLDNLLLWAIAQSEQKSIQKKWINLQGIFTEIEYIYRLQMASKKVSLDTRLNDRLEIHVDEEMLKVVMRNLTHNALKFCNPGDKVVLNAEFEDETATATIRVVDSGIGIPKNVQDTLLEKGDVTTTAGTGDERGTALGLMLCKEYLQINDSSLNLDTTEGKGSTFWFTVTARITSRPKDPPYPDRDRS